MLRLMFDSKWFQEAGASAASMIGDTGGHVRSRAMIGRCCKKWSEQFQTTFHLLWGPESHMHGRLDGEFGAESKLVSAACHSGTWLWTIADLVRVMTHAHTTYPDVHGCTWTFFDGMPPMERDDHVKSLVYTRPESLPLGLKQAHHWSFTLNDKRNLARTGTALGGVKRSDALTGIMSHAHVMPGLRCVAERTVDGRWCP